MIRIAGALSVRSSHVWSVNAPRFDEPNLVSCAGLVPVLALAEQTGMEPLLHGSGSRRRRSARVG